MSAVRGWRRPRPDPGAGERGAVAVEAAILVPILVVLLLGVIEFATLMRDVLSLTETTRVGARTASAQSRDPDFTQLTVAAIGRSGSALPKSRITQVLIYKANDKGYPGPDGNDVWSCTGAESTCDRYVWDAGSSSFVLSPAGSPWNPRVGAGNVNACPSGLGGPPDSVGVYVEAWHPWMVGGGSEPRILREHAVLPFEPLPSGVCR
jgi:TadE-like protein